MRDLGRRWGVEEHGDSVLGAPFTASVSMSPSRAAQEPPWPGCCSFGPAEESQTLPGLPPDGTGSSAPLASATVALIKRTICLPLNQTQIPFPSNVPEASRDSGRLSRLHLRPRGPASPAQPLSVRSSLGEGCRRWERVHHRTGEEAANGALFTRPCPPGPTCRGLRVRAGSDSSGQQTRVTCFTGHRRKKPQARHVLGTPCGPLTVLGVFIPRLTLRGRRPHALHRQRN